MSESIYYNHNNYHIRPAADTLEMPRNVRARNSSLGMEAVSTFDQLSSTILSSFGEERERIETNLAILHGIPDANMIDSVEYDPSSGQWVPSLVGMTAETFVLSDSTDVTEYDGSNSETIHSVQNISMSIELRQVQLNTPDFEQAASIQPPLHPSTYKRSSDLFRHNVTSFKVTAIAIASDSLMVLDSLQNRELNRLDSMRFASSMKEMIMNQVAGAESNRHGAHAYILSQHTTDKSPTCFNSDTIKQFESEINQAESSLTTSGFFYDHKASYSLCDVIRLIIIVDCINANGNHSIGTFIPTSAFEGFVDRSGEAQVFDRPMSGKIGSNAFLARSFIPRYAFPLGSEGMGPSNDHVRTLFTGIASRYGTSKLSDHAEGSAHSILKVITLGLGTTEEDLAEILGYHFRFYNLTDITAFNYRQVLYCASTGSSTMFYDYGVSLFVETNLGYDSESATLGHTPSLHVTPSLLNYRSASYYRAFKCIEDINDIYSEDPDTFVTNMIYNSKVAHPYTFIGFEYHPNVITNGTIVPLYVYPKDSPHSISLLRRDASPSNYKVDSDLGFVNEGAECYDFQDSFHYTYDETVTYLKGIFNAKSNSNGSRLACGLGRYAINHFVDEMASYIVFKHRYALM